MLVVRRANGRAPSQDTWLLAFLLEVIVLAFPTVSELVVSGLASVGADQLGNRLVIWSELWGSILQHSVIGNGRNSTSIATMQNGYIERFNRSYRTEVLDAYVFTSLQDVRELTAAWLVSYNTERPHDSFGRVPPLRFLPRPTASPGSLTPNVYLAGKLTAPLADLVGMNVKALRQLGERGPALHGREGDLGLEGGGVIATGEQGS